MKFSVAFFCAFTMTAAADMPRVNLIENRHTQSFSYIFYPNTPMPPAPTVEEIASARTLVENYIRSPLDHGPENQAGLLRRLYGDDYQLWALALRDTDRDGIRDFQISNYFGMFYEGDIDIDGDGIRNVLDRDPYDPTVPSGPEKNAILSRVVLPPHLVEHKSAKVDQMQFDIYHNYDVVVVNQGAEFSETYVQSIRDTLEVLFGDFIRRHGGSFPALKTIAARPMDIEATPQEIDLYKKIYGEEPGAWNGWYAPGQQSFQIFDRSKGLSLPPIDQLDILAHEFTHAFQTSFDLLDQELAIAYNYNYYPKYWAYLDNFNWQMTYRGPTKTFVAQPLFTRMFDSLYSPDASWLGWNLSRWDSWYNGLGDDFLATDFANYFIPEPYSMTSESEWHADMVTAYFLDLLARAIEKKCTPAGYAKIATVWTQYLESTWSFRFLNVRDHAPPANLSGPCASNSGPFCESIRQGKNPFLAQLRQDFPVDTDRIDLDHYLEETPMLKGLCRL